MGLTKWGALAIAAVLAFLTIWFMPGGNFFAGLIVAVVMIAVGVLALREKKTH
jgi:energy-converting hydrogenase Eha subunit B